MALDMHIDENGVRHYVQNPLDPDKPVVLTGAVSGPFTLSDATVYDLTEPAVETASHAHAGELDHHIGLHYERHGHPRHVSRFADDYDPLVDEFHHVCAPTCGAAKRSIRQQHADFEQRLKNLGHGRKVGTAEHKAVKSRLSADHARLNKES